MTMSVHDALQAWQDGEISEAAALRLSGCDDVFDMLRSCISNDIEIRLSLTEDQQRLVDRQRSMMELYADLDALEQKDEP